MKKLMMSLMAVALLSTVASAKTTEKAPKENVNVKTTTYRLPKTNTLAKVTEEVKESKGRVVVVDRSLERVELFGVFNAVARS
ncbi:hypothetical protein [Sphingobacterium sp. B29]|uniref:hypothetical protein n=1 Tax=Sphingobacterium sp. B29 TaxID=1933220 RepID=UPI0012F965B8|nr:hypothetical protein [Sphingobacterium sp. B29]